MPGMPMRAESPSSPRQPRRRVTGPVVPNAPRWYQRLAARIVYLLVRAIDLTIRYRWNDHSQFFHDGAGPAIYCVWHNRLALCLMVYRRYTRRYVNTPGMAALVSASKDGALLAAILECFSVEPVRGSSSRRGPQALLELTGWGERGYDLAITPDGPRGPCYQVQDGIMSLAQLTGLAILPVSYSLSWKIRPRSWDRFQIPLPFSRCDVFVEPPIRVPREASDAQREALRIELETALKRISHD